ncbi:MAG: hypothetical protein SH856_01975 [Flavobacteriales bacterium]|nr:hypothetical protein [Flavobacteriales bacterium]
MNLQDILEPIVSALQWFFKILLEPTSHWLNWVCIAIAFIGIFYWMRRQGNYNRKALKEGTTP